MKRLHGMELFAEVAKAHSFSRAAAALGVPTSTVSRHVAELERSVGLRLLNRNTRRVELTDAGQVLYREAQTLLRQAEDVRTLVQRVDAGLRGRLRIGFVGSMLYRGLPALLNAMRAELPDVEHVLTELNSHDQIEAVRRGEQDTQVDIYDGSEIGVLQAGFNEMMRGLRDRQRVRDVFSQYVGAEVAQKALEERPELGGEERKVAVLFIDVIGSTTYAVDHTPEEVVAALNEFFDVVVEVVHRNKGVINKFQGDAALAVFGAPVSLHDAASHALQAARELQDELSGQELKAGIGVASGHVVAGHIGGSDRFEYTVIGDAVNGAARLTELAKDTPGLVLTNAATLRAANEVEQQRWTLMKSVELRGRGKMTQLARPVRSTMADRY